LLKIGSVCRRDRQRLPALNRTDDVLKRFEKLFALGFQFHGFSDVFACLRPRSGTDKS